MALRRFHASVTRLSRRAKIILAIALLLLVWRCSSPLKRLVQLCAPSHPRSVAVKPDPRVRFAPSRSRPPSARIRFANGATQEVFPARIGQGSQPYQRLWETSPVVDIDLPLGARLWWTGVQGRQGRIERGRGDNCAEGACEDMARIKLEFDAALGLRQLRDSDPAQPLVLEVPCATRVDPDDVTLVTQFSISRFDRFERMLAAWNGPLSATIYLVDEPDIFVLEQYLPSPTRSPAWNRVSLVVVKPDFSVTEQALVTRLRYPINRLRNLALSAAPSRYVLTVDVDFVPSLNLHSILATYGTALIERPSSIHSRSPTLRRTAVVVPTFALAPSFDGRYPNTTQELAALFHANPPIATLTDANAGHGPSLPSLLFSQSRTAGSSPAVSDFLDPTASFEVCYEPQWEPYYLLALASHPLYDERFTDQGGDKQAHALLLNALGYEFRVVRDAWVVHPPRGTYGEEDWPAKRLVQRHGEPEHAGTARADHADADADEHFNFAAQRDESRFRYFQDLLPEIERDWGRTVRWPRGCDAKVIASRRSFGKARAAALFGL